MHDYVPRILTSSLRPLRSSRPLWPSSLPCRSDSFLNATIIITNIINMTPICRLLGGWSALFPTEIRSWQQPGEGGSATPTGAEPQIAGNLRSRLTRSRTRIHPGDHCFRHRKGLRPASAVPRGEAGCLEPRESEEEPKETDPALLTSPWPLKTRLFQGHLEQHNLLPNAWLPCTDPQRMKKF